MKYRIHSFTHTILILSCTAFVFFMLLLNICHAQTQPPDKVAYMYSLTKDSLISDDFNSIDWAKWTYREKMGADSSYINIENDNLTYVSIAGKDNSKLGSGLCSINSATYGFYIAKWRTKGIYANKPTAWHPAIWGAAWNFGLEKRELDPMPNKWLEIDLMEVYHYPTWCIHTIAWQGDTLNITQRLKNETKLFTDPEWSVTGIEYTPHYVALWEFTESKWYFRKSIPFTDDKTTTNQINVEHRQPCYWILSNKYNYPKASSDDTWLHVDYFYYYPYLTQYD